MHKERRDLPAIVDIGVEAVLDRDLDGVVDDDLSWVSGEHACLCLRLLLYELLFVECVVCSRVEGKERRSQRCAQVSASE